MSQAKKLYISQSVSENDCVFCKIVKRQLPSYIVFEDGNYIAFLDNYPFNIGHTLVCPRKHGETIWDMTHEEIGGLFMVASKVSRAVVKATGSDGFRFVQNNGEAANQVVPHVHVHTIPVKFNEKGRWLDRKKFSEQEMTDVAARISKEIRSD